MNKAQIKNSKPGTVFQMADYNAAFEGEPIMQFRSQRNGLSSKGVEHALKSGFVLKTNSGYKKYNRKCEALHWWNTTPDNFK